jgi:hypothetical protein
VLSDTTKLNRAFKAIFGAAHTEDARLFFQELFPYLLDILGQDVKTQAVPLWPGAQLDGWTDGIIMSDVRAMTPVPTTGNKVWAVNNTPGNWSTPRRFHYVHPRYDTPFNGGVKNLVTSGYVIKLYQDDGMGGPGAQIPPTATPDGSPSTGGWEFEYESGILYWTAVPTAFTLPFHIEAFRYVGTFGNFGGVGTVQKVYSTPYAYLGPLAVGDAVYIDPAVTDTVRRADNAALATADVIGFVSQKDVPAPGQCIVQVAGEVAGLAPVGLGPPFFGKWLYLGTAGAVTDTPPLAGIVKPVGVARSNSTLAMGLEPLTIL